MDSEQQEAFIILQSRSRGLEETFLSAGFDLTLSKDDEDYARQACAEILAALDLIRE